MVEGTLDIQNFQLTMLHDAELYVKAGGKIIGKNVDGSSAELVVADNAHMYVSGDDFH